MTCNNSIHDLNCPDSYNNNSLKCASAVVNQQQKQFVFNQQEVNILSKSLEVCQFYITKNQAQFQQSQDIIKELTTASNILNARRQNKQNQNQQSLKGASLDINNNNPFKSLDNIFKMFGLTSNESIAHLKGASSDSTQNKNNICSNKKEHLKDLLKQFNLI